MTGTEPTAPIRADDIAVRATYRAHIVRAVRKETVTLDLDTAPYVEFTRFVAGHRQDAGSARPRRADVVVTSIDGIVWHVQGVTVAASDVDGGAVGRYFRRRQSDGSWAEDTPEWIRLLALDIATGELDDPANVCGVCGYAVLESTPGRWDHVSAADVDHAPSSISGAGS